MFCGWNHSNKPQHQLLGVDRLDPYCWVYPSHCMYVCVYIYMYDMYMYINDMYIYICMICIYIYIYGMTSHYIPIRYPTKSNFLAGWMICVHGLNPDVWCFNHYFGWWNFHCEWRKSPFWLVRSLSLVKSVKSHCCLLNPHLQWFNQCWRLNHRETAKAKSQFDVPQLWPEIPVISE